MAIATGNMMTDVGLGAVGVVSGVGTVLGVRQQFDQTGETTVLRPSVLWGVGSGLTALVLPMLMGGYQESATWDVLEDYGMAALGAGLFSAFSPKGGGVQFPTL